MTLKAFHVLFVTVSTLMSAGFSAWSLHEYLTKGGELAHLAWGALSLAAAAALVVYGGWFLKKMKDVSYL